MARNEEGEFELVLGNKQLLSVFFILVVLLGVFFSMGYVVGRSNPSSDAVTTAMNRKLHEAGSQTPRVVEESGAESSAAAARRSEPVVDLPTSKSAASKEKTEEQPPPPRPERTAPVAGGVVAQPPSGAYLQVAAIDRQGAMILADSLRKRNFPAIVSPGPSETIFRVVVGPLQTPEDIASTRTRLEGVGLKGAMVRRYKSD